jgi:hypothetical protein
LMRWERGMRLLEATPEVNRLRAINTKTNTLVDIYFLCSSYSHWITRSEDGYGTEFETILSNLLL